MILAPVTVQADTLHRIRKTQWAWGVALQLAAVRDADVVTVAAARRLAADAECELRDLWNAA